MNENILQEKLNNLEAQFAFQESTISELNQALVSQQAQIAQLEKQMALLAQKVQDNQPDALMPQGMEPPPPHY